MERSKSFRWNTCKWYRWYSGKLYRHRDSKHLEKAGKGRYHIQWIIYGHGFRIFYPALWWCNGCFYVPRSFSRQYSPLDSRIGVFSHWPEYLIYKYEKYNPFFTGHMHSAHRLCSCTVLFTNPISFKSKPIFIFILITRHSPVFFYWLVFMYDRICAYDNKARL